MPKSMAKLYNIFALKITIFLLKITEANFWKISHHDFYSEKYQLMYVFKLRNYEFSVTMYKLIMTDNTNFLCNRYKIMNTIDFQNSKRIKRINIIYNVN